LEKLVIIVGDRRHPNAHHLKLSGSVRVGRALSCDVILSDSHVEPLQLLFHEGEHKRTVEVLPGVNPVRCNGLVVKPGTYDFISGDEWSLGRTILLAFNESHTVEPTEKLVMREYRGSLFTRTAIILLTLLLLSGFIVLNDWLAAYQPMEWKKQVSDLTSVVTLVFIWAAVWAAIGRFITGRNLFIVHFAASSLFVIAVTANEIFSSYMSYALNMYLFWELIHYVNFSLLIGLLLYVNFAYATNIKNMKIMQVMLGLCCGVFLYFIDHEGENKLKPHFNKAIKPPFAILVQPETVDDFMLRTNQGFVDVIQKAGSD
jgi:hypothetical protein